MKNPKIAKGTKNVAENDSVASFGSNQDVENTVFSESEQEELYYSSVPEPRKGEAFKFGSYCQNDLTTKTPIEWLVLKKSDSKILLISRFVLDFKQYHHESGRISWEKCDLRKWLNGEFFQSAFSEEERKAIELTELETDEKKYTKDRIFCLSMKEVSNLFDGSVDERCMPVSNVREKLKSSTSNWWLRSPEKGLYGGYGFASCAPSETFFRSTVVTALIPVRPALWVNFDLLRRCVNTEKTELISDAVPPRKDLLPPLEENNYFKFGSYYQEGASKKTPIEWLVLEKTDSKALLISRYCLDCRQYHHEWDDITWDRCDLRKWLNGEFLHTAFSDEEQKKIAVTKLANDNNPKFDSCSEGLSLPWGGSCTEDRIFCLSLAEAESLFKDDEFLRCMAVAKNNGQRSDYWWLRSPGKEARNAAFVCNDGHLHLEGRRVVDTTYGVRPALWVNMDSPKNDRDMAVTVGNAVEQTDASKLYATELKRGDSFVFGSYYWENDSQKTPIEWFVLKRTDSKALLISRYGLDCKLYHHEKADITWENCDLRKWLNGEFLNNAFNDTEQKMIVVTKLVNDVNPKYGTFGGNSTEDRVFLLSILEVERLCKFYEVRVCSVSPYACNKGVSVSDSIFCDWWLRSPGKRKSEAAYVDDYGKPEFEGTSISYHQSSECENGTTAVRPAIWVNL